MANSYSEQRDAQGRTTIELAGRHAGLMLACGALGALPLLIFGWAALYFVLANVLVFGSLAAWFQFANRRMRLTFDPGARTLKVEGELRPRVLACSEVARAQINSNRVELLLGSGEVLPLMRGSGQLSIEDCARLVARINAELAPRAT